MMEILKTVAEKFLGSLGQQGGEGLNIGVVVQALTKLLAGADGKLDLSNIVGLLKGQGLGALVESWLGDGGNSPISAEAVGNLFGGEKLAGFASTLNVQPDQAAQGLADALPSLIDGSSQGGSLTENASGALDALKGLF